MKHKKKSAAQKKLEFYNKQQFHTYIQIKNIFFAKTYL